MDGSTTQPERAKQLLVLQVGKLRAMERLNELPLQKMLQYIHFLYLLVKHKSVSKITKGKPSHSLGG